MFKQMKKTLKNQKGLTLIELLAVIVILGIIAAIAVPSIGGIINKTKDDAKVAEGVQIISAAKLYITTNPTATTIASSELTKYLDNTKDTSFTVSVSQDSTTKKYTYTLKDHEAAPIIKAGTTDVTEAELLKYSGN